jgi:branched-subunit amino acid transport protein
MSNYSEWLASQDETSNPDIARLKAFAGSIPDDWPKRTSNPSAYIRAIDEKGADQKESLLSSLVETMSEWKKTRVGSLKEALVRAVNDALDNFGLVILSVAALIISGIIARGVFNTEFLTSISAPEQARGLITFLFSFSTVAIFLLIVVCIFFFKTDDLTKRIDHAKDILSLIIGIFGTILGFYFGSMSNNQRDVDKALYIANVHADPNIATPGNTVTVTASALGGSKPYTYDFIAVDSTGNAGVSIERKDQPVDKATGALSEPVVIPAKASTPSSITYTFTLRDANKASAQIRGVIDVVPKKQ